jgi:hypothetical protein
VFGAGPPAPIDWGEAAGAAFAGSIATHEAAAFSASFDLGFVFVQLAGCLNKKLLTISAYSTFTDQSGRANYFQRDQFYRPRP